MEDVCRQHREMADDRLQDAYLRARQVGYQPGTAQVDELERAEQTYREASKQWYQALDWYLWSRQLAPDAAAPIRGHRRDAPGQP